MNAKKFAIYLAPFFINSAVRIVGIPLTTYILGPEEFGLFALMMGVVAVCTALASSATGYDLNHKAKPGDVAPNHLIVTLAVSEAIVGLILAVLSMAGWPFFSRWMGISGDVSTWGFLVLLLSVPLGAFWTSGSVMVVFDGKAALYSGTLVAQGIVQLVAQLVALYIFGWHVGALIAGQFLGIATCAIGGYLALRRHLSMGIDWRTVRETLSLMPWAMASNLANSSTDLLERVLLGRVTSAYELGLYVHSQSYRTMFGAGGKAFVQVLQPAMMREARALDPNFSETRDGWNVVYVMFSLFGMVFALLGQEIIGALTHGKSTGAAIFVPFWCIFLTFQYLGRAQVATLYAHGQGKKISASLLAANMVSGCLMILLGIPFHAPGLVTAVLLGELTNRALLQHWTRRRWNLPFQDFYALAGAACIVAAVALNYLLMPPLAIRLVLLATIILSALALVGPAARRFLLAK